MSQPTPATAQAVDAFLAESPRWTNVSGRLATSFKFRSFGNAMEFMVRVANHAERLDHHPDWSNSYRTVTVELVTHSVSAVTTLDFELARAMDEEASALGAESLGDGSSSS